VIRRAVHHQAAAVAVGIRALRVRTARRITGGGARRAMSARVLVVDDEEALRVSVAKILSRLGHTVDTAGTATEGLRLLSTQPYELVLTDFRLPDLDGLEVLARARAIRPEAEVVLFTGFGSIPLAVQAIKHGAYDFVTKPFKRADLERGGARPRKTGAGGRQPAAPPPAR
jgi:DNA-binding NtrC family response regulator